MYAIISLGIPTSMPPIPFYSGFLRTNSLEVNISYMFIKGKNNPFADDIKDINLYN